MDGVQTDVEKVSIFGKDCIHLGFHLTEHIARTVVSTLPASAYAIITDTNLAALFLHDIESAFRASLPNKSTSRIVTHTIAPGEQSKSRAGKAAIEDYLLAQRCTRDTVLIAVGGGVVGDLVGFVAATFMRGVRFVQVPTTLLAMVDSAVGGKTAIDVPLGKNLIGAFHQPEYIFIDAAMLQTLPAREFENGMAEIIKTAAIWKADDFEKLEDGVEPIRSAVLHRAESPARAGQTLTTRTASQKVLLDVIKGSIGVKAHIVTIDEKETGLRNLVNFGHTVGHALEAVLTPEILHGECVAIGMVIEAEISRALGHLSNAAVGRLIRCIASYGLPVTVRDPRIVKAPKAGELNIERLLDVMRVDKKNAGPVKKVVLLSRIGKTVEEEATGVADEVIVRALAPALRIRSLARTSVARSVTVQTPGSKSISNRVLVLAALAQGTTRITNLLHSDDTQVMMAALKTMNGATFAWEADGEVLVVRGGGGRLQAPANGQPVYLGNAGTAARFLTAVTTLAAGKERITLTGNARMKQRPIAPLVDALVSNNCDLRSVETPGCMPLSVAPTGLKGGKISLAASISSQYVSAILLAAPYAREVVELELVGGEVISQLYIDMTIALMAQFGIRVERISDRSYRIPTGTYSGCDLLAVESDASSATYPLAVAAITGTTCTIPNIGSGSLQGDARFAKDVLEPMGCSVQQTATSTTVTGPAVGGLRAISEVDMEPMTDAFMTAAVLAAVAKEGATTRITGIANQRVKECNRIEAMRVQLAKFGVVVRELPDGIEVDGVSPSELGLHPRGADGAPLANGFAHPPDVRVHCYDDHRIAMAFSVLAAVPGGPGALIEDRRCVEKTWPSWWDDLSRSIGGVFLEGVEAPTDPPKFKRNGYQPAATVILVGMRGAGKTYSGTIIAGALGRPLIDADQYFEHQEGIGVREFVKQHSWPAFRRRELQYCKELLANHATGYVIAMGGGVIETPEAFQLLKTFGETQGPVVNVMRDIDEIVAYLGAESARPSLGEPIEVIAARRAPLLKECSTYDLQTFIGSVYEASASAAARRSGIQLPNTQSLPGSRDSIARFSRFIAGKDSSLLDLTGRTYFLPLTFPDILPALPLIDEITTGVDALEFRVDLLSPDGKAPTVRHTPPLAFVGTQLAALRQQTSLPVIFTVRTVSQGGMFPDEAAEAYFELLHQAVRWGCEFIDLQWGFDHGQTMAMVEAKRGSRIVASYHDWSGTLKWDAPEVSAIYNRLSKFGDVVKIVTKAQEIEDCFQMMAFRRSVPTTKPLLTLCMGADGQMSRILNPTLSPVTHPALAASAPGQLSFQQTMTALHLLGQLPKRHFFLFGSPIAHSKSPLFHNTAFGLLGLPHRYGLHESEEADEQVRSILRSPDFGGASVTIPLKLKCLSFVDHLSDEVREIGALNTIVPLQQKDGSTELLGRNTDATGFRDLLLRSLRPDHNLSSSSCGLVIGAGGTARAALWALHAIGLKRIFIFNRTTATAQALARAAPNEHNVEAITALDSSSFGGESPAVVICTVPGEATSTSSCPNAAAGIHLPDALLGRSAGGVVIDAAYKPKRTPLIRAAESRSQQGWVAVPGIYLLIEQAFHQSQLWTGRRVARGPLEKVVLEQYERENPSLP